MQGRTITRLIFVADVKSMVTNITPSMDLDVLVFYLIRTLP